MLIPNLSVAGAHSSVINIQVVSMAIMKKKISGLRNPYDSLDLSDFFFIFFVREFLVLKIIKLD